MYGQLQKQLFTAQNKLTNKWSVLWISVDLTKSWRHWKSNRYTHHSPRIPQTLLASSFYPTLVARGFSCAVSGCSLCSLLWPARKAGHIFLAALSRSLRRPSADAAWPPGRFLPALTRKNLWYPEYSYPTCIQNIKERGRQVPNTNLVKFVKK